MFLENIRPPARSEKSANCEAAGGTDSSLRWMLRGKILACRIRAEAGYLSMDILLFIYIFSQTVKYYNYL